MVMELMDERKIPGQEEQRKACFIGKNNGGIKTALKRGSHHWVLSA